MKVTLNLPRALVDELRTQSESEGKTFTQAVKEALALELYVTEVRDSGGKLLAKIPGEPMREIVFRSALSR